MRDRNLLRGIAGSLVVHLLLLVLLIATISLPTPQWRARPNLETRPPPVKEIVLVLEPAPAPPMPVPAPEQPTPRDYIRTTQNEPSPAAPKSAPFQSDRNTKATAMKAPAPDATLALPSTDGINKPTLELANRDLRDGQLADDAPPKALAVPTMKAPAPQSVSLPEPPPPKTPPVQVAKAEPGGGPLLKVMEEMERDAMKVQVERLPLEIRKPGEPPKPAPTPSASSPSAQQTAANAPPRKPAPKQIVDPFVPFTRTSAVKGTISNRGNENAVDAEKTPLGVYMRAVTGAVEQRWHKYRLLQRDAVTFGSLRVRFYVTRDGTPEDLRIVSDLKDADPRMADFTLRAVRDAEIPPIPEDLLPTLDSERVKIEYDVLIY